MTALRIASLERVKVGKTPTAKLIAAEANRRGGNLGDVLRDIGKLVGLSEWTVYAWLRGSREPHGLVLDGLRARLAEASTEASNDAAPGAASAESSPAA